MCTETAIRADIRVSVQDRSLPDRVAGHVATGILVDADAILVPNPPARLLEADLDAEVLIFPTDLSPHIAIEARPVWKWSTFRVGDGQPLAAVAKLERSSRYVAQVGRADAATLAVALGETRGDLWEALRSQRLIRDGIECVDADLLTRASELERIQRRPRNPEHVFDSHAGLTRGLCVLFCFCEPHGPQ
ncbi:hypothetical protein [Micromonospora sp. AP08]|uniref:hypothetical protein n=1 Tax=Micromonospora sp. AP08 TaxID=2604467 RepID=UPI0016526F8B|nr:hypothetical protein [Micromonospora sp. AP08]